MASDKPIGLTQDAGYQVGVRKTFDVDTEAMWRFLAGESGIRQWLGGPVSEVLKAGNSFETSAGTGQFRVVRAHSHIRLSWQPQGWDNETLLQLRVISNNGQTTVAFHQDQLTDALQREEMKKHWKAVLNNIESAFSA